MFKFLAGKFGKGGLRGLLVRLHRDEQGAEGIEKLLIIAAIILPLLGVLIIFRDKITEWVGAKWGDIAGRSGEQDPGLDDPDL